MGKKTANHLHKYRKVNLGQNGKEYLVYQCSKPACSHYIPIQLAEGKLCECNRCGEAMIITRATLHGSQNKPLAKPHCPNCIERKTTANVDMVAEFLKKTGS